MNTRVSTYQRNIQSHIAEHILSNSKIYLDMTILRSHFLERFDSKNSDLYRFLKSADENNGYISTRYSSRNKITNRMFTTKGSLNLITLSDKRILSAIKSRYKEDGVIVCLDYKAFEPTIISSILNLSIKDDLHSWAADLLSIERSQIKIHNMELMYCSNFKSSAKEFVSQYKGAINPDLIFEYINELKNIREKIDSYVQPHNETYLKHNYIINTYGRKIFPKESRNIFSNMIQSIGSEILVDDIIMIHKLDKSETHLLFHRFDSLYFDISKKELPVVLPKIVNIMRNTRNQINFNIDIKIGDSVNSLKDINSG